jgi:hypothetical protein
MLHIGVLVVTVAFELACLVFVMTPPYTCCDESAVDSKGEWGRIETNESAPPSARMWLDEYLDPSCWAVKLWVLLIHTCRSLHHSCRRHLFALAQ